MGKDKHSGMKITPDSGHRLALSRHRSRYEIEQEEAERLFTIPGTSWEEGKLWPGMCPALPTSLRANEHHMNHQKQKFSLPLQHQFWERSESKDSDISNEHAHTSRGGRTPAGGSTHRHAPWMWLQHIHWSYCQIGILYERPLNLYIWFMAAQPLATHIAPPDPISDIGAHFLLLLRHFYT